MIEIFYWMFSSIINIYRNIHTPGLCKLFLIDLFISLMFEPNTLAGSFSKAKCDIIQTTYV